MSTMPPPHSPPSSSAMLPLFSSLLLPLVLLVPYNSFTLSVCHVYMHGFMHLYINLLLWPQKSQHSPLYSVFLLPLYHIYTVS